MVSRPAVAPRTDVPVLAGYRDAPPAARVAAPALPAVEVWGAQRKEPRPCDTVCSHSQVTEVELIAKQQEVVSESDAICNLVANRSGMCHTKYTERDAHGGFIPTESRPVSGGRIVTPAVSECSTTDVMHPEMTMRTDQSSARYVGSRGPWDHHFTQMGWTWCEHGLPVPYVMRPVEASEVSEPIIYVELDASR